MAYSYNRKDLKYDLLKSGNIWNSDFLKVEFQMVRFSNGEAYAMTTAIVPTIWKLNHSKSRCFCPDFKWGSDKMVAICPDFKWLGFQISDPILNLDHLQPNLFLTIQNPD